MRIWAITDGITKEAYKVSGAVYKCFPKSCNDKTYAKEFSDIRDAARFLLDNEDWGIRMNPGAAIIYKGLNISR